MGLLDDLRRKLAKTLASEAAESASKKAEQTASRFVEDFVGSAEKALERAKAERGGDAEKASNTDEADKVAKPLGHARAARLAREQRAADELARLKAQLNPAGDSTEPSETSDGDSPTPAEPPLPKKTL